MRYVTLLLFLQPATAGPVVETEPIAHVGDDFQYCLAPGVLNISAWAKNRSKNHWQPPADWTDMTKHSPMSLAQDCTAHFEGGDFYAARSWQKLAASVGDKQWEEANNIGEGCCEECKGFWQHGLLKLKRECKSGLTCHGGYCIAQNVGQAFLRGTKNALLSPESAGAAVVMLGGAVAGAVGGAFAAGGETLAAGGEAVAAEAEVVAAEVVHPLRALGIALEKSAGR